MQASARPVYFSKLIYKYTQSLQDPKHVVAVTVIVSHGVALVAVVPCGVVVSRSCCAMCGVGGAVVVLYGVVVAVVMLRAIQSLLSCCVLL